MKDDLISRQDDFEKQIHAMFDHIWDCEIDHPVFQDTVGDLMGAVIQCHKGMPSAEPEERALHESCTDCPLYDKDRHRCPRFNKVIPETLREVQSEQRWIPVTERLPKKAGNYLVTYHNGDIAICLYLDSEKSKDYWMRYVKAWMPLPTPWEGEQDGTV